MSVLLTLLLVAGSPPEAVVKKPKMICERVHEVGSIRLKRVCVPAEESEAAARARRDSAEQIRQQNDRERQLVKDNAGDVPL